MAEPIIEFKNFSFRYDSQAEPNLIDIDFAIYPGETVLIVGPSGSGKSTLGKAINGQIPNSFPGEISGDVKVNGQSIQEASIFDLSLSVGTVLQDTDGQFVGLTVAEDLAFSLENEETPQADMLVEVDDWAQRLDIDQLKTNRPQELSGGQKQRVSIGGVLINQVPILLFDEPLANLDPKAGHQTIQLINDLKKAYNFTTIIIEHRLEECLEADIDRVLVMDEGRVQAYTSVDDLLRGDLLERVGLRQPLYLDALKTAQVSLDKLNQLSSYRKTPVPNEVLAQVDDFYSALASPDRPSQSGSSILEVKDLAFAYARQLTPSIREVSFRVEAGEMISMIGTNGAGKSTMAKLICGFERMDEGQIMIDGVDQSTLTIKEIADRVGYVMQNPNQMISKSMVFDEVALGLVNRKWPADEIEARVHDTLKVCGLYPFRKWPISALSYGQKRRVTIASILALDPQIIILDEPTAGQDYRNYSDMMNFIADLNQDQGVTILMITHDMHLMQDYTQRSLVFDQGRLIADTQPADIFSDPDLMEAASLVPSSLYFLGEDLPRLSSQDFLRAYINRKRGEGDE